MDDDFKERLCLMIIDPFCGVIRRVQNSGDDIIPQRPSIPEPLHEAGGLIDT